MAYKHAAKQVGRPMMGSAKGKALKSKTKSSKPKAKSPNSGKKVGDVFSKIESKSSNKDISLVATPNDDLTVAPMPRQDGFAYNKIAGSQMKGKAMTSDEMAAQQKGNPIMPNLKKEEYTDSGMNYRDANSKIIKGSQVDEGELSSVIRKSPERPYVKGGKDSMYADEKLYLDKAAKMVAQHPSKQRMENMVNKVAQYKMPNAKAAQKRNCKY